MKTMMAAAHAASPLDLGHAPLLLFDHDGKTAADGTQASDGTFSFYSIPEKQVLRTRVDEMTDHRYWTTPQGWLLMAARASPATFLWDPFTGARINLPPDREGFLKGDDRKRCLLSRRTATDPGCLVLVVGFTGTVLWHCRLRQDERWLRHEVEAATLGTTPSHVFWSVSTLTPVDGMFFMWALADEVVTLEFSPEPVFTIIPVPLDQGKANLPPCSGSFSAQLVEAGGDLFCVCFSHSGLRGITSVNVLKLDLTARAWVKAESLGGKVFIVSLQFGASLCPQQVKNLKGDCIYYVVPGDNALYIYDMRRGTTSLHNPAPHLLDYSLPKILMPTL